MLKPTPYPDINGVLAELLIGVQAELGEQFVGMYLFGSLAYGGFVPGRSDIDFLVVTRGKLDQPHVAALEELHGQLQAGGGPWAARLEGCYLPARFLCRHDPEDEVHPALTHEEGFTQDHFGADWDLQRYTLLRYPLVLAGPPPSDLIDPVDMADLQRGVRSLLAGWWRQPLEGADWIRPPGYQAFAALTMCRALYLLEENDFPNKPQAVSWAQEHLPARWAALATAADAWREGQDFDRLDEVLDFIRYTYQRTGVPISE
jgi:hypothetical protein